MKILKIIIILFSINSYSQKSEDLEKIYQSYLKKEPSQTNKTLIEYLVKQYELIESSEIKFQKILKSPSKSEYLKLESLGEKFLENRINFEQNNLEKPKDLNEDKLREFAYVKFQIERCYELFWSFLNSDNDKIKKEDYYKVYNDSKKKLIDLIQNF